MHTHTNECECECECNYKSLGLQKAKRHETTTAHTHNRFYITILTHTHTHKHDSILAHMDVKYLYIHAKYESIEHIKIVYKIFSITIAVLQQNISATFYGSKGVECQMIGRFTITTRTTKPPKKKKTHTHSISSGIKCSRLSFAACISACVGICYSCPFVLLSFIDGAQTIAFGAKVIQHFLSFCNKCHKI